MPANHTLQPVETDRDPTSDLPEGLRHRLLASFRRRRVLATLTERAGASSVDELADALAAESADDADRIALDLHHVHLPMLADADVVDYDSVAQVVHPAD